MQVIDADSHVGESEAMFDLLDKEYYAKRPQAVGFSADSGFGPFNAAWAIDGKMFPNPVGKGATLLLTPTFMDLNKASPCSIPSMELTDVPARLADMDRMGIEKQVIYPSLFLAATAADVGLEAALMRCYNTFVAQACTRSEGRLAFAAVVPIRDTDAAISELRRAKGLGAVAVMLHGMPWDMTLGDKSLYPFYEAVQNLDIPVVVHFSWGSPAITNLFDVRETGFNSSMVPVVMSCYSLMVCGVMETFPRLRVGFLESGSMWVPWVIHQIRRGAKTRGVGGRDAIEYFRDGRAYVACEADEDINFLVSWVGEDAILVGSDYPHPDPSAEEQLVDAMMGREDVPLRVREKILSANPASFYRLH